MSGRHRAQPTRLPLRDAAKQCFVLLSLTALAACAAVPPPARVAPQATTFASKQPKISSVDPTNDNQLRDGVRIIVTPVPFRFDRTTTTEFRLQSSILLVNGGPAERRDRSEPGYGPEEFRFKIRVSNRLPRVVRLAGTAVAFQLAGRTINVPQERYANFLTGIVLPQQEVALELVPGDGEPPTTSAFISSRYVLRSIDGISEPARVLDQATLRTTVLKGDFRLSGMHVQLGTIAPALLTYSLGTAALPSAGLIRYNVILAEPIGFSVSASISSQIQV